MPMPEKSDEERHAEFCAIEDKKYGPGHCNCMRGPRAKGDHSLEEVLEQLWKLVYEMEAGAASEASGVGEAGEGAGGESVCE